MVILRGTRRRDRCPSADRWRIVASAITAQFVHPTIPSATCVLQPSVVTGITGGPTRATGRHSSPATARLTCRISPRLLLGFGLGAAERYVREPERRLVGSATSVFEVDPGLGEREGKTSVEVGSGIIGPVPCLDLGPGPTTVEGPEELVGRGSDRSHPARPSGVRVTDLPGPEVCCHYVERGRPGSRQFQAPATDRSLDPEPGSSTSSGRTSRSSGRSSVAPSPC